jgi:hypothetical protein
LLFTPIAIEYTALHLLQPLSGFSEFTICPATLISPFNSGPDFNAGPGDFNVPCPPPFRMVNQQQQMRQRNMMFMAPIDVDAMDVTPNIDNLNMDADGILDEMEHNLERENEEEEWMFDRMRQQHGNTAQQQMWRVMKNDLLKHPILTFVEADQDSP